MRGNLASNCKPRKTINFYINDNNVNVKSLKTEETEDKQVSLFVHEPLQRQYQ